MDHVVYVPMHKNKCPSFVKMAVSELLRRVVWLKFTVVSEALDAAIIMVCQTTLRSNPEDRHLRIPRRENLKSYIHHLCYTAWIYSQTLFTYRSCAIVCVKTITDCLCCSSHYLTNVLSCLAFNSRQFFLDHSRHLITGKSIINDPNFTLYAVKDVYLNIKLK